MGKTPQDDAVWPPAMPGAASCNQLGNTQVAASRSRRRLLGLITVLVCIALLWVIFRSKQTAPLTANLPNVPTGWESMKVEFDRRLKASFPIGSAASQLEGELERQGFVRLDSPAVKGRPLAVGTKGEVVRMRPEDRFPCDQAAYVFWRTDNDGRLVAIRGDYREEGCL